MTTFGQDLIKIVLDKALIAVILSALGFYLNKRLEQWKTALAFSTELNKTKVQKFAEVWEALYLTIGQVDSILDLSRGQGSRAGPLPPAIRDEIVRAATQREKLHQLIQTHRFWMKDATWRKMDHHAKAIDDFVDAVGKQDRERADSARDKLERSRLTIDQLRDELLSERTAQHRAAMGGKRMQTLLLIVPWIFLSGLGGPFGALICAGFIVTDQWC